MQTLLIAIGAGVAFLVAYHTYGKWLGRKIFGLAADRVCPSHRLRDDQDYVPTRRSIVFGHHFTSIAGTGPIVGPAIAVMWGWVPALLWVVLGSIFIGAVHDLGSLVVSLRNNGQTVGDIAGRVLNRRVRLLFLLVLFLALTIVIAVFGLVIAAVFRLYPAAIFPCMVQIPIAVAIGLWLHRKGVNLLVPSILALAVMYLAVIFGDAGWLGEANAWMASWPTIVWVGVLLVYSYIASVIPVWVLLQPRDYINSLQLLSALGLIVLGLVAAAFWGGAPPVEGASRPALEIAAPAVDFSPEGAPLIFPFLFITIACGAISGFHCLVSSGTSSKQLENEEPDARFVGYGAMLMEGFLAVLVILACVAGLGLGSPTPGESTVDATGLPSAGFRDGVAEFVDAEGEQCHVGTLRPGDVHASELDESDFTNPADVVIGSGGLNSAMSPIGPDEIYHEAEYGVWVGPARLVPGERPVRDVRLTGASAFNTRYQSWTAAGSLGAKVGAFVDGAANLLRSFDIPLGVAVALMGVLVASFAGTTLDTACRLQRYVVQELAATFLPGLPDRMCRACGYDLEGNVSGSCPECGEEISDSAPSRQERLATLSPLNPARWLTGKHAATIFAIAIAGAMAALPAPGAAWTLASAGSGGMILWPMFGATNQLLAGLAFLVIAFYLWRRKKPVWFLAIPLVFMLVMPAWAMLVQLPEWVNPSGGASPNWVLIVIAVATLVLELWMAVEAVLLWPKVRGVLEEQLEGAEAGAEAEAEPVPAGAG
ncbi:MAG: carbon starvation protein A [Phycisphaeraceae bacterium]